MRCESGLAWTALRNGFYATSGAQIVTFAVETGELVAPEDGPFSWTAHADLAEAAARILAEESHDGITPPLTGSEAIDMAGVAAMASEITGRPIRRVVVSEEQARADAAAQGQSEQTVRMRVGLFAAARLDHFAQVDPALTKLIGRPPTSMRQVLEETLSLETA
jgi:NAD(P)H dehydrogenase (quinone)